ncbi:unnamed protein product [Allacma fusca]|uniref:WASP family protein member n=1 Tax=Allacma fusca TaxID=39272 RepID=A0A8J2PXM3_9HEXA|nr:unnamed protein product [Allacma fusca]
MCAIKENGMRAPAVLKHEGEPWNALETLEKQLLASETMENEKLSTKFYWITKDTRPESGAGREKTIYKRADMHCGPSHTTPLLPPKFSSESRSKKLYPELGAGMPLVHRVVVPVKLSATKLQLNKNDSEFVAVNNGTLVNVLRQLASLVTHANGIFSEVAVLTEKVGKRVRSVKLRLDELEAKAELFDPKLVPVPEGNLDEINVSHTIRGVVLDADLFSRTSRPTFLIRLYDKAGNHEPKFPPRSPIVLTASNAERHGSAVEGRRPASFAALREWKLDDYVDEKIATLDAKKLSSVDAVQRTVSSTFPSQMVQVDVTGRGFDRMKANRRSLVIHTKKVRVKKRRNTICGSMPNKECGIQTSFSSVASPTDNKKYGIDSGHWSSCTSSAQGGVGAPSSSSAPSPWDPNSLSTSSDFLFDDEDRSLTPQLENFTDGLVSDSDSVDTEGYFTSFRNECGFPKSKKSGKEKDETAVAATTENEYELFGKGSTSTTASSCGTVVMRNKPEPPARTSSVENMLDKKAQSEDTGWEERVKRKSLIERVPSLVVITPSPSCSSGSPPPLKDPGLVLDHDESDSGRQTPRGDFSNDSETCTLSDTDSDRPEVKLSDIPRPSSTNSTASSSNSTRTLTNCPTTLPQPDVIPDVQVIRTIPVSKLDIGKEYYSLDTVLLGSSEEDHHDVQSNEAKTNLSPAVSSKVRGARVVLDANGEIIFSSETLRRKRRHKVSFDPGDAVKQQEYGSGSNYARIRESVYERIRKDTNEKLYECIEEIRRHNLQASDASFQQKSRMCTSPSSDSPDLKNNLSPNNRSTGIRDRAKINVLLETDLDSAIPPVMPELKTLPKIKDRLKRNESYRIATDEIPPRPPLHSLNSKRMSLPQNNKKRDIPEEDPVFIQQILNMSNNAHCNSPRSPTESLNRITLSKFALSPDDRPSFLRRDLARMYLI